MSLKKATPIKKKVTPEKLKKKAVSVEVKEKKAKKIESGSEKKKKYVEVEEKEFSSAPIVKAPFVAPPPKQVAPPPPPPAPIQVQAPIVAPKKSVQPAAPKKEVKKSAPLSKEKHVAAPEKKKVSPEPSKPVGVTSAPHKVSPVKEMAPALAANKPAFKQTERERDVEGEPTSTAVTRKKIKFNEMMTVKDLSDAMEIKVIDVIKKLLTLGAPVTINQRINFDVASLVADSFNCDLELKSIYVDEAVEETEDQSQLVSRSPVVTVMGHVDHGKTSLLDAIRFASVASGEAGGITQHIGAYQVKTAKGSITFLDTPGHEAFTAMRARGATVTDLVILVVAADDSVMPQTIEAIDHAKAAGVPIVVAINKMDLPVANVQKVKQELAQHELLAEDWGGKTVMVEVSAKTRKNLDKLLEMILLETELLELKANPNRPARGVVLEARVDPKRGVTATILIQTGTLKVGDVVVCGLTSGRVRAMLDDKWQPLETAGPSTPSAVLGLSQVPQVGDQLAVVGSDQEAREIVEKRKIYAKEAADKKTGHLSLESLHAQIAEGKLQELKVILKADVQGSLQAIQDSLGKISGASIQIRFVHAAVGNINESDVLLAEAADAVVFGFNVKAEGDAEAEAKHAGVDIRTYQIIYEMLADVRAAMEGLLKPEEREVVKGRATVKSVFASSRFGSIAGCMVLEGKIVRGSKARVVRNAQVLGTGLIGSLKRFKEDVREVEKGFECGLAVEGVKAYAAGDLIEAYVMEKHARRLDPA